MCHMPSFEKKKNLYFFSMGVFYTLIRGWNQKKFPQTFQILLFRSSAIILPTKILQKLTFSCHWKMLMSTLCHSVLFLHISNFFMSSGRYPVWEIICHFVNCFPHEDIRHGDIGTESIILAVCLFKTREVICPPSPQGHLLSIINH